MDKEARKQMLQKFLENALSEHNKQKKSFAGFMFDTLTFVGLVITFAILPNHLVSLKNTSSIALNQKQYFQPTEIRVDQQLKIDPQDRPRINVKEIITPELKQKIDRIVKRADAINNL